MRRTLTFMLFALSLLVGTLAAGEDHPWNNRKIYYVIESLGQLVEKGEFVRRLGSYQKRPCWVVDEEKSFYAGNNPDPVRSVRTRTLSTMTGEALQRTETSLMGDKAQETVTIINDDAVITATGAYGQPGTVPVPRGVLFEITGEWLAAQPLSMGRALQAFVLDRVTRGVVTTDIVVVGSEPAGPDKPQVWLADITTPGRPPVRARFTGDGRLLRLEGSGLIYQVVGREEFELGRIPGDEIYNPQRRNDLDDDSDFFAHEMGDDFDGGPGPGSAYSGTEDRRPASGSYASGGSEPGYSPIGRSRGGGAVIPIGASIPAWDNFAWLVMRADPANEWATAVPNSDYAQVDLQGSNVIITALRNAPFLDGDVNFPMAVPADLQRYLGASPMLPSGHQAVIEAAYVAVSDTDSRREETNVLRAVSFLAGWINQSVAVEPWKGYDSSALETLAKRSGDSLGHARLFAAMARTLGVPTRLCQGLLAYMNQAVNHCWSEAWINGRWVPVDTTVSRVGLPAGYVLAERGNGRGEFRMDFANFLRSPALRLTVLSGGRETPAGEEVELVVGDRRSYAVSEGDWLANLYWGFALRLPRGWTGQAKLNSVELASRDGKGTVKCEALEGDFQAGKEELDGTISSLRGNLRSFRLIESRIVSFDAEGATPALFIDFSCIQNGTELRCKQYVVPRRQRAFRISFWAPADRYGNYAREFDSVLASFEF